MPPLREILTLLAGLFCAYGALRNLVGGSDTWWLYCGSARVRRCWLVSGLGVR